MGHTMPPGQTVEVIVAMTPLDPDVAGSVNGFRFLYRVGDTLYEASTRDVKLELRPGGHAR